MPHDDHGHTHGHGHGHRQGPRPGHAHDAAPARDHAAEHDHDHDHGHDDHDHGHDHDHRHGHGHHHPHPHEPVVLPNQGEAAVWERWQKKRTFVRALEGTYGELVRELFHQPRVFHSKDWKWKGGPHNYGKKIINPQAVKVAQSIECHLDLYAPNGIGQKHGHMNSAVFYVLKGKGHDVHDGRRLDWEAGDALIVENGCVHQHCSDEPQDECIVLIMKAKPLFLFMHLMFQKIVDYPPTEPGPGQALYQPPTEI